MDVGDACANIMGVASFWELDRYVHRFADVLLDFSNFALASLMAIYAAVKLATAYTDEFIELTWTLALSYIVMLVGGIAILADANRNLLRSVGIYALALGFHRFISAAPNVGPGSVIGLGYLVICVLGLNLMVSGRSYLRGVSRGRRTVMFSTFLILMCYLTQYIMLMRMGFSIEECISSSPGEAVMCVMYAVFIGIVDSEPLRSSDILEIHNEALNGLRCTQFTDPEVRISRGTAEILAAAFTDRSAWTPVSDGGPAECEFRFTVDNRDRKSEVLVQKWEGSESLYFTVSDNLDGTVLQAYRFEADSVYTDGDPSVCSRVRMFGRSGICMQLAVDDPEFEGVGI